tara:strand:- start:51 stop:527 length:477 start_codon:yes stop_codon:yes gene_type:complete
LNNIFPIVYSNYNYILIAIGIFLLLFFTLITVSEFLFLQPFVTLVVYPETFVSFLLIIILSIFSAIAISLNVYRVKLIKETKKIGSSIIGTIIGASAGACSCGPIAFSIITTFGTAGSIASSFLTIYETPIRLTSIGILILVIFITIKSLSRECKIKS